VIVIYSITVIFISELLAVATLSVSEIICWWSYDVFRVYES